jgi:hypothetical protein
MVGVANIIACTRISRANIFLDFNLLFYVFMLLIAFPIMVCSYPKGGTFTTKLDLESASWRMINLRQLADCGVKPVPIFHRENPAFWVGAVMGWLFKSLSIFQGINVLFTNAKNLFNIFNNGIANFFVQDNWFAININWFLS